MLGYEFLFCAAIRALMEPTDPHIETFVIRKSPLRIGMGLLCFAQTASEFVYFAYSTVKLAERDSVSASKRSFKYA